MGLMTDLSDDKVQELEFSFQWHVDDVIRLAQHEATEATPLWARGIAYFAYLIGFIIVFILTLWLFPQVPLWGVLLLAFLAQFSGTINLILQAIIARITLNAKAIDPKKVGLNHVIISRQGIRWASETTHDYRSWAAVKSLSFSETEGLIIDYSERETHFLPLRLFESAPRFRKAESLIRLYRAEQTEPAHIESDRSEPDADSTRTLN
ncbi:MAG: hypothetical protein Hens3KO_10020 [Henriciella sp.]